MWGSLRSSAVQLERVQLQVRKVIFVLWCGKYGLNKLGSRKYFYLAIEFVFLIVRLNKKWKKWMESGENPNTVDMTVLSWDCPFGSHCVNLLCKCTEYCMVLAHIRGYLQDWCHFDVFHWWRWIKYKVVTGSQLRVNVMVWLTIVILKNVAVALLGEIMTSVIPDDIII